MPVTTNVRASAARIVDGVVHEGQSLDAALGAVDPAPSGRDRALLQELCFGVLRWQLRLDAMAQRLLRAPLKPRDRVLRALLWVGLYQLQYLRTPPYAALSSTVDAARALGKPAAAGLINGVLRNAQRQAAALADAVDRDDWVRFSHPRWLLQALSADWPEDWQRIAAANNTRASMTLRVNLRRHGCAAYAQQLSADGLTAQPAPWGDAGLVLEEPVDVGRLPGFADGSVSVQDAAAQLAAPLLEAGAGMRVLDACAAPGGKTAHILERSPQLAELVAVDRDPQRLRRVEETLQRLHLQARLICGDAAHPEDWWHEPGFDRLLLDAPCSATGVIRRHPDIKALRRASDIDDLVTLQASILDGLWPLLVPGGILVYATCSVLERENSLQIARFLQHHADARELPIDAEWGRSRLHGRQTVPGEAGADGFFYARLYKSAPPDG